MGKNLVIGIAGGSGSGKTTVAEMIADYLGRERVVLVVQDNYYVDLGHMAPEERAKVNFDHPSSVDLDFMAGHMKQLKNKQPINMPQYDFKSHTRLPQTLYIKPKEVIIIEGILVLDSKKLRDLMDVKLYVDTDDDIRFIRRLKRDIQERGRSIDSVIDQYLNTVRPMHLEFVDKSKRYADIILPWRSFNSAAVSMVKNMVRGFLDLD